MVIQKIIAINSFIAIQTEEFLNVSQNSKFRLTGCVVPTLDDVLIFDFGYIRETRESNDFDVKTGVAFILQRTKMGSQIGEFLRGNISSSCRPFATSMFVLYCVDWLR